MLQLFQLELVIKVKYSHCYLIKLTLLLTNQMQLLLKTIEDLIKIDIEGGELSALLGMKKTITSHKPFIIIEVLPANRENITMRQEMNRKINETIASLNYKIYNIKEGNYSFELVLLSEIPAEKYDLKNYNYLLIPN